MSDQINLSIIIPVYNSEKYLEQCVDSVLDQTYPAFELILVDDVSTDSSGDICDRISQKDSRVKVLHHKENKGLSISREDGFKISSGEWIGYVDNDDYICPALYERLMSHISEGDMVCTRGEDRNAGEIDAYAGAEWKSGPEELIIMEGKEACDRIFSGEMDAGFIRSVWGKIIKRTLIDKVLHKLDKYKERLYWVYMEDVLFTPLLFYYSGHVIIDNTLMYLHRRMMDNLSSTLIPKEYHYQAVCAGEILLDFFRAKKMQKAYEKYMTGYFMLVMSMWYKVWKNEKDEKKKIGYYRYVSRLYKKYARSIKGIRTKGVYGFVQKYMILLFDHNRSLWGCTIGKLYFERGRKGSY